MVGAGVVVGAGLLVVAAADVGATVAGNVTTGPVFDVTCSEAHPANANATRPVPHHRRFILRSVDRSTPPRRSRYCGAGCSSCAGCSCSRR